MRLNARRAAPLLAAIVVLGLLLGACSGGGGEEVATTTTVVGAAPAGPTTTTVAGGLSPAQKLVGSVLEPTKDSPSDVSTAMEEGRPMVVSFYVSGGTDDTAVVGSLRKLESRFRDYGFMSYDYKYPDKYGDLALLLKVDYTPVVFFIDATGTIRQVFSGYVDEGSLNQALVNVGES